MFDDWDSTRTERDTGHEVIQAANALAVACLAAAGVTRLRWMAGSTACPICLEMNGRVTDIRVAFVQAGDSIEGEGQTAPLVTDRSFSHPPLHDGCVCQVGAG
jgi:hypothetical protein